MKNKIIAIAALLLVGLAFGVGAPFLASKKAAPVIAEAPVPNVSKIMDGLQEVLAVYRKIIVLSADQKALGAGERELANQVGKALFHENRQRVIELETSLESLAASRIPLRFDALATILDYVESNGELYDADRLAFRELLRSLQADVARDTSLPAIKLHKRIGEDLGALAEIERNYEKEIRQVFGRFEPRAIELKSERWEDYVASLKKRYTREQILKERGVVVLCPV